MNRKKIIIVEIIVWLIIIGLGLCIFINRIMLKDDSHSYYLFFDDAGGLVKGSPVRLMGMNIGYVRDVKIFDNKVFVSFLVTKKDVTVPNRATATVEFYGLGGSTSLEISPKTSSKIDNREIIIPSSTYRIQDYWDGAKLSANVMIDIYGSIGRTIDSTGILYHKDMLKQNKLVREYAEKTNLINEEQTVIINKLSDLTKDYRIKKEKEAEKNEIDEAKDE